MEYKRLLATYRHDSADLTKVAEKLCNLFNVTFKEIKIEKVARAEKKKKFFTRREYETFIETYQYYLTYEGTAEQHIHFIRGLNAFKIGVEWSWQQR